jgi:hypothetical protein
MRTTAIVPGCPVDDSFEPLAPEFLIDPYAALSKLPLAEAPVFFAPTLRYLNVRQCAGLQAGGEGGRR